MSDGLMYFARTPLRSCEAGTPRKREVPEITQMRPERLQAWQALRERYGNRDESRVDRGRLLPPTA